MNLVKITYPYNMNFAEAFFYIEHSKYLFYKYIKSDIEVINQINKYSGFITHENIDIINLDFNFDTSNPFLIRYKELLTDRIRIDKLDYIISL